VIFQNRPNAPTGSGRRNLLQNVDKRLAEAAAKGDKEQITSTDWPVLTRPPVAGFNAPNDSTARRGGSHMNNSNTPGTQPNSVIGTSIVMD
jgi:hypothetical protein